MDELSQTSLSYLPDTVETGPANMAIDVAMLRACAGGGAAFRCYGWREPTITFGFSQRFADVRDLFSAEAAAGLYFVRRPTGGGVVDHRGDWTYALAIPAGLALARAVPVDIYREIHACLAEVIGDLGGPPVVLAPCPRTCEGPTMAAQAVAVCFNDPVADDVVLSGGGGKVAGAAMKRTRAGVLIQGSVRPQPINGKCGDSARRVFFDAFAFALARLLGTGWTVAKQENEAPFTSDTELAKDRERFASEAWTKRR